MHRSARATKSSWWVATMTVALLTLAWVRFREQVHAAVKDATGGAFSG